MAQVLSLGLSLHMPWEAENMKLSIPRRGSLGTGTGNKLSAWQCLHLETTDYL